MRIYEYKRKRIDCMDTANPFFIRYVRLHWLPIRLVYGIPDAGLRLHRFRVNHLDGSGEVPMEIVRNFIGISIYNSFSVRK